MTNLNTNTDSAVITESMKKHATETVKAFTKMATCHGMKEGIIDRTGPIGLCFSITLRM